MKKIFLLAIVGFLATSNLSAQTWLAGVRGGFNVTNISGDYSDEFKIKPGYVAGLFTEYKTGDRSGFFMDLLYSTKGANIDANSGGLSDGRFNFSYIDIPIALVYYPVEPFGLYVGPQISLLVDSKLKSGSKEENYNDVIEANDYGVVGGFRYRATPRVHLDLRFYQSLSDLSTLNLFKQKSGIDGVDESINTKDRIQAASLTISYGIFYRE